MKQNVLQNIIGFILRYIWFICALLVVLELVSVTYTAGVLMKQSSLGVLQSVSGEVSGRVDGVLRLLTGFANDERFADTSKPMFDRVTQAMPYQESYNLYMIAMTDKEIHVISADETEPPAEPYSLAYRDYLQRLYHTGKYQITDAFLSGDNTNTRNYTIAVPIMKNGTVEGSIFGSIYFQDIEEALNKQSQNKGRKFYLLGANHTIMAGDEGEIYGKSFAELSKNSYLAGQNIEGIEKAMKEGKPGSFWQWDQEGLFYATYQTVLPTEWTILYRVEFLSFFVKLVPAMCIKICFYILMCAGIFLMGRRYLRKHLAQVNHMINRMAAVQKELFQSEQLDYDNIIELTEQGLVDQLTGLSTRAILFKKMVPLIETENSYGAVVFIDLDDLKYINDHYGHEGGDGALIYFAQILKEYEQTYQGVAARYGGDEFIFIFHAVAKKEAIEIVQTLCVALNASITVKEHKFTIHGSLGISFYPEQGRKAEELICKADLALYSAKQKGKNRCDFFEENSTIV